MAFLVLLPQGFQQFVVGSEPRILSGKDDTAFDE
jgi:hypothetical protein